MLKIRESEVNCRSLVYKRSYILFTLLILCWGSYAQYYRTGSEPIGVRWQQIRTDHLQIIFPEEHAEMAQTFASKFEYALEFMKPGLNKPPRKLSVILHNYHPRSNGLVSWAPSRMELWTRPSQKTDAQDWLETLIIHEYRHFIQISNLDQGFTSVLKWIFGQQGQVVPLGLFMPMWYIEGDAVVAETVLSHAGRGRDPSFSQEFKALILEQGIPKYEKLFLPSFKQYVPDHYVTGYHLVAAHLLYNSEAVLSDKMRKIARYPWILNPFSAKPRGLRDRGKAKFYNEAVSLLDSLWNNVHAHHSKLSENFELISSQEYENYVELKMDGGRLYAYAESFGSLPSIVMANDHVPQAVKSMGVYAGKEYDIANDQLVWVETNTNALWDQKGSADIWLTNLQGHEKKRLTRHGSYASPSLNSVSGEIAVVKSSADYHFELQILDAKNGEVIHSVPNNNNDYLLHPTWSDDGTYLCYITLNKDGKGLSVWSPESGVKVVMKNQFEEIYNPVFIKRHIYFSAGYDGSKQIYVLSLDDGQVSKLTNAPFGADYPAIDVADNKLYYASYHSNGNRIVVQPLDEGIPVQQGELSKQRFRMADPLSKNGEGAIDFENRPVKTYDVKPYRKLWHSINLHSWFPAVIDINQNELYPGLTLLSQDVLGNSVLSLKYNANPSMRDQMFSADYTYYGVWPNVSLKYAGGFDTEPFNYSQEVFDNRGRVVDVIDTQIEVNRIYQNVSATLSFPLDFSQHSYYAGIRPEIAANFQTTKVSFDLGSGGQSYRDTYVPLLFWSSVYWLKQKAKRDLEYPWGIKGALAYKTSDYGLESTPGEEYVDNLGAVYGYDFTAYMKGLFPHHSLMFRHAYQKKLPGATITDDEDAVVGHQYMHNLFSLPRGYYDTNNTQMLRLSLDYHLPIAYPDWNLGWFTYIRRISGGLFVDFGDMKNSANEQLLSKSYGGLIYFDTNFLRYEVDVKIGIQGGYNTLTKTSFTNLILTTDMPW